MKRPVGVVLSAILLIIGSLFQLLLAVLEGFAGALETRGTLPVSAPLPSFMPFLMYAACAFILALAIWGILTAVGLFRLRSWARHSILVIGGATALISFGCLLMFLLMASVPLPLPAGAGAPHPENAQALLKVTIGVFAALNGIVCAVCVSWLVYFNRKKVREVFTVRAGQRVESRRPLLISVIAVLKLFGAVMCLLMTVSPFPLAIFGWILHGWAKVTLCLVYAGVGGASGFGLWKLAEWGRKLALGWTAIGILHAAVCIVFPSLMLRNHAAIHELMNPTQPQTPGLFQKWIFSAMFGFSILVCLGIAAVLVHYRAAFRRPAEPPQAESHSQ